MSHTRIEMQAMQAQIETARQLQRLADLIEKFMDDEEEE